jgi:hypothetical protein
MHAATNVCVTIVCTLLRDVRLVAARARTAGGHVWRLHALRR